MAKKSPTKVTLRLPKKQTVELTVSQVADVLDQIYDIFGPPPPVFIPVPVLVPAQQNATGQNHLEHQCVITGRN